MKLIRYDFACFLGWILQCARVKAYLKREKSGGFDVQVRRGCVRLNRTMDVLEPSRQLRLGS